MPHSFAKTLLTETFEKLHHFLLRMAMSLIYLGETHFLHVFSLGSIFICHVLHKCGRGVNGGIRSFFFYYQPSFD
jgi:hypothetical protein